MGFMMSGVDLEAKALDVARIARALYGTKVQDAGFEWDEFQSQLFWVILSRNRGETPYDPTRASLSRYVSVVCRTTLNHMKMARWRRERKHALGVRLADGSVVDAAVAAVSVAAPPSGQSVEDASRELLKVSGLVEAVERAAFLILLGHKTKEVAAEIGATKEVAAWVRAKIRAAADKVSQ